MAMSKSNIVRLRAALRSPTGDAADEDVTLDRAGNLHDAAYLRISRALADGRFVPGQAFTIRALAEVFGTSPMPARDALKRLVAERVLELRPNRSVLLPVMSRGRFQEILQIRLALEPMLAMRAALHMTAASIEAMQSDHEAMCDAVRCGSAVDYLAANRRFHFRLYKAAGTAVMLPIVESMWMQIGPYLNQIFSSKPAATAVAGHHHLHILRALRRGDGAAAAEGVWNDLADAADEILSGNLFAETSA